MDFVVDKIINYLDTTKLEDDDEKSLIGPNEVSIRRQGASEALASLVEKLGVRIVPYAVLFMVPLLGRMSDPNEDVRLICSSTFATLVQLLPLDPGVIDTSHLMYVLFMKYIFIFYYTCKRLDHY